MKTFKVTVTQFDASDKETAKEQYTFTVPSKNLQLHKTDLVSSFSWLKQTKPDKESLLAVGEYALVWDQRLKDGTPALNESWTLSSNKRELTICNAVMGGAFKRWYVFDKQE